VGGRIGRGRVGLVAALIRVGEAAEGSWRPPRVDRRVDDAVTEVEVPLRVRVEVGQERAEEANYEGDRRQDGERDEVGPFEPEPPVETGTPAG